MTTALQIVNGAAEKLGVKTAEAPLEAVDAQSILDEMNDLLLEWADLNLTPAFDEITDLSATVYVDRNAVSAIKNNLALRIAPTFQRVVSQALASIADTSLRALEASSVYIGEVALPDTLPVGSGNECGSQYYNDRFFDENKSENF